MEMFLSLSSDACDRYDSFDLNGLYTSVDTGLKGGIIAGQLIRGSRGSAQYAVIIELEGVPEADSLRSAVMEVTARALLTNVHSFRVFNVEPVPLSKRKNSSSVLDAVAGSLPKREPLMLGDLDARFLEAAAVKNGCAYKGSATFARFVEFTSDTNARYFLCSADMKSKKVYLYDLVIMPIGAQRSRIISFKEVTDQQFKYTSVGVVRRAVDQYLEKAKV